MVKVDLNGKIVVVTGAGRGIGKCIALALAEQGATVIVAARTSSEIEALARQIHAAGGKAEAIPLDVTKENEVIAFFDHLIEKYGQVDILINNAGSNISGPFVDFPVQSVEEMYKINVAGCFLCCREALRVMSPKKSGYIINMSSVMGFRGYVDQAGYAASKHAVVGMTKTLAIEAQKYNIRVSLIHPGAVNTPMGRSARPELDPQTMMVPEDIAQVVLFLLSQSEHSAIDEIYIRRQSGKPF